MTDQSEIPRRRHTLDQELARLMSPMHGANGLDDAWRDQAVCSFLCREQLVPLSLWFSSEQTSDSVLAAQLCWQCPVREQCLQWASATKQRHGIWGGLPASVRLHNGRPHDYEELVQLPNPYDTDNIRSRFHASKLKDDDGQEE